MLLYFKLKILLLACAIFMCAAYTDSKGSRNFGLS